MATISLGKNAYLVVNNCLLAGGTAAAELGLNIASDELDASVIQRHWKDMLQGQAEATLDVSGIWDAGTANTRPDSVLFAMANAGGTSLFELLPEGSAVNRIRYVGNCMLTKYNVAPSRGGVVPFAASLRMSNIWSPPADLALWAKLYQANTNAATFPTHDRQAPTATVTAATWSNQGYVFDASDQISVPDSTILDLAAGTFTVLAWVKLPTAAGASYPCVASKMNAAAANGWRFYYVKDTGRITFDGNNDPTQNNAIFVAKAADDGQWHQWGVTSGGDFYWDGKFLANSAYVVTSLASDGNLLIGKGPGVDTFAGTIAEVQVYTRALTAAEILTAHQEAQRRMPWLA